MDHSNYFKGEKKEADEGKSKHDGKGKEVDRRESEANNKSRAVEDFGQRFGRL